MDCNAVPNGAVLNGSTPPPLPWDSAILDSARKDTPKHVRVFARARVAGKWNIMVELDGLDAPPPRPSPGPQHSSILDSQRDTWLSWYRAALGQRDT